MGQGWKRTNTGFNISGLATALQPNAAGCSGTRAVSEDAATFQTSALGERKGKWFLSCPLPVACLSLAKDYLLRLCLPHPTESATQPLPGHQGAGVAQTVHWYRGPSSLVTAVACSSGFVTMDQMARKMA